MRVFPGCPVARSVSLSLARSPPGSMAAPQRSLVDQIADRHAELESLVRVAAKAYREAQQPERKHEWHLAALLVSAVLLIIGLSAALSWSGRFGSDVAFVMGTALGAFAAILKDFLLPVVE